MAIRFPVSTGHVGEPPWQRLTSVETSSRSATPEPFAISMRSRLFEDSTRVADEML
ncbi:Hypothetical protein A7982_02115 [Minicystis rosea]|nr:Hypothetical protein A7982_02115 [Minicystis rosea]